MKPIPNPVFRNYLGKEIENIKSFVATWLEKHPYGEIYVGTDSKARGKWVKYSTVICLWDVGKGVSELYKNEVSPKPHDAYARLWEEVTKAVDIASELKSLGKITVHVDINSNPKFRSYRLYDASMGLINSMGFEAAGKPFSWAATSGAHRHCQG